jgi:hypothetical protein
VGFQSVNVLHIVRCGVLTLGTLGEGYGDGSQSLSSSRLRFMPLAAREFEECILVSVGASLQCLVIKRYLQDSGRSKTVDMDCNEEEEQV